MPDEEIRYWNNRDEWPEDRQDEWDDGPPPDEERCQRSLGSRRCGLPRHGDENGEARCIFHYTGDDRDDDDLQRQLEAAVESEAFLLGADLSGAHLSGADLSGAILLGAYLSEAILGFADLSGANLFEADLSEAILGFADLSGANLFEADLSEAILRHAYLSGAALQDADLSEAKLEDAHLNETCLWGADLSEADLRHAYLSGATLFEADLSEAILRHADLSEAILQYADLTEAKLRWTQLTDRCDLRHATLTNAKLIECEISPDTKLEGAEWGEDDVIRHEPEAWDEKDDENRAHAFRGCAAVYRQIKQSYQHSGQYQRAGSFFIRERECERFAMAAEGPPTEEGRAWYQRAWDWLSERCPWPARGWRWLGARCKCLRPVWQWLGRRWDWVSHYASRAGWFLSYWTCQHGENPWRLFGVMAILVVLFAAGHCVFGVVDNAAPPADAPQYVIAPGLEFGDVAEWPGQALQALYFSAVTFTSLGYGDMRPATGGGQILAIVEVFLGVALIAVFVGCMIRKLSR